jgi:hypothetical protein
MNTTYKSLMLAAISMFLLYLFGWGVGFWLVVILWIVFPPTFNE